MEWTEVLIRLGLAILFGLMVGMEREHHHRPAGIKTHILVCIGAALVSLIQVEMLERTVLAIHEDPVLANVLKVDNGRLGAQVISGIGFLGAGTIIRNKGTIKGLTTAATLWLTACVGLAVGMGYYLISITVIALTMIVLISLRIFQNMMLKVRGVKYIEVSLFDKQEAMKYINYYCSVHNIMIRNIEFCGTSTHLENEAISGSHLTYMYELLIPRSATEKRILTDWQMDQYIASAIISDSAVE